MRLRHRFIFFSVLVIVGPIIGLGLVTTHLISQAKLRSAPEMLEHELEMAWVEYWNHGQQMRLGMLQAAHEPPIQNLVRLRDRAALRDLMRAWRVQHPHADLWLVTAPDGEVVARLDSDRIGDLGPLKDLIGAAIERREPILSTEILSTETLEEENLSAPTAGGALAVVAVTPVFCDDWICGLIVAGDIVEGQSHLPGTLWEESRAPIAFISQRTEIVATSMQRPEGSSALSDLLPASVIEQVAAGTPYRGTVTIGGEPFLMATDPIRDGRGNVVGTLSVGLPTRLFSMLRRGAVQAAIVSLLLAMVLAVGVATVLDRRMARPLEELTTKAQAIAAGDLSVRVSTSGADEIGQLSQAFDLMARQLEESYGKAAEEHSKAVTAIEASRDAIWVSDANRRVVMVNSALERLTGRRRDDLLGQTCRYLLGVQTLDGASVCDTACPFLHSDGGGTIEGCIMSVSGKEIWVEISYGRVTDASDRLTGVMHIVRDLTQRKEVERLKDEFVSMVSHELRTPLHHIKGFARTLLQTDVEWDAPTQRDFLESISRESDRLADLVEKILHLSRLESAALPMEKDWHQVSDLANGALRWRRSLIEERQVHLDLSSDLPAIFVDGREIEVVLINLLENAVKYSSPGAPITLGVERQGDQVIFSVADQGMGIPAEHLQRIFERFYRVVGEGPRIVGTGLGLAICERIVKAHGGRIWVESTPGGGSQFFFSLPVEGVD